MNNLNKIGLIRAASLLVLMFAGSVTSAAVINLTVDNQSFDGAGAPGNDILTVDLATALGAASGSEIEIDAIGWNLDIDTVGVSWLSEASVSFGDAALGAQVSLAPGNGDDFAGSGSYTSGGLIDLVVLDLVISLADGVLVIEFFEGFDDVAGITDAFITGSLDISARVVGTPVPVPAALWLMCSALLGLVGARRRT